MSLLIVTTNVNFIRNGVLTQKGFPFHLENCDLFYFKLPSQGCHRAVHVLWKQPKNENSTPRQLQLIEQLRSCKKTFYTRAMRREIQSKLKYLGVVKARHAVYVIKDLLGDDLAASSQNGKWGIYYSRHRKKQWEKNQI